MSVQKTSPILRLATRIAEVLGLVFDFADGQSIDGIHEQDVAAQLHYGRN